MFYLTMLFLLASAHAVADFAFQNEFIAIYKSQHQKCPFIKGKAWPWILIGHTLPHGAAVMVITGNFWLGLTELVIHTAIDYAKSDHRFGFHTDQILHYTSKAAYVFLIWFGLSDSLWQDVYTQLVPYLNR